MLLLLGTETGDVLFLDMRKGGFHGNFTPVHSAEVSNIHVLFSVLHILVYTVNILLIFCRHFTHKNKNKKKHEKYFHNVNLKCVSKLEGKMV